MGFSFRVELGARRPSFSQLVQPAPALIGAGPERDRWPTGVLQRVPDLSSRPCSLRLPSALEALYERAGFSGGFLAHRPARSTRGVEVSWHQGSVFFRVPVFGSIDDYELAVTLAAAAASAGVVPVWPEHGPDGQPIGSVTPEAALRLFDASFAERHLGDTSAQALASSEPLWCFAPRGWVGIAPTLAETQLALKSPSPTDPALEAQSNVIATALTRAMLLVGEADGELRGDKAVQMRAALLLDADLRGFDFDELLNAAASSRDLAALAALSPGLRAKALILAAEVAAAAQRQGAPARTTTSEALSSLASVLQVPETEALISASRTTFAAKFVGGELSREASQSLVEAMLLAAMTDGQIDPLELGTCLAAFQSRHSMVELVPLAEARILKDMAEVVAGFERLSGKARDHAFVLACEVAFANGGLTDRGQAGLRQLRDWLKPDETLVESALTTLSAKHR